MALWKRITRSNFFIRLRSWEYWPFGIIQFPAIIYWILLSLRARSFVFFSAANPGIPMGGMFGESKYVVLKKIPPGYVPHTLLFSKVTPASEVKQQIAAAGLAWPLIFKPDIGERGYMVKKLTDEKEVADYVKNVRGDFLVQEWINLPLEFGVFYMRFPAAKAGRVISLVKKEMLHVTGDGYSSLQELILRNDRAKLQWRKLQKAYRDELDSVPPAGKKLELVSIGNHALGTRFINANHLINDRLSETFDAISRQIDGFYFGRFDLRCASLEDLYAGKVKVMELNGCGAEPGHIYDVEFGLWNALRDPVQYWNHIYRIAHANKKTVWIMRATARHLPITVSSNPLSND